MKTENSKTEHSPAKWFAVVDDLRIPMPQRIVNETVLRAQAGVPDDKVIVRDHNSPNDDVIADGAELDLGLGNVFYLVSRCTANPPAPCPAPAKLAFSVDDRVEETVAETQTAKSLIGLVGIVSSVHLFRDHESPRDEPIDGEEQIHFIDGPVFYTRPCYASTTEIIVNGEKKTVEGHTISYDLVVRLAFARPEPNTIYTVTYKKGPPSNPEGRMISGNTVEIICGEIFNVTATAQS